MQSVPFRLVPKSMPLLYVFIFRKAAVTGTCALRLAAEGHLGIGTTRAESKRDLMGWSCAVFTENVQ